MKDDKAKAIQVLAFEQGLAEGYNRGYAEGKAVGRLEGMKEQHAIEYKDKNEAYEHGRAEGQADLIEKLKDKLKPIIHNWQSEEGSRVYDGSHENTDEHEEQLNEMIKELASESLEVAEGSKPLNSTLSSVKPKSEKPKKVK